jgi:hypothetical protein
MKSNHHFHLLWGWVSLWILFGSMTAAQTVGDIDKLNELKEEEAEKAKNVVKDVRISCNSEDITVSIYTIEAVFNGMVYPKGLSKNSTCMTEYINHEGAVVYIIPLRSCNTMSTDVDDGVEFFNTIVVQPHRKLVTNQGRGYHIRCRYRTEEKTLLTNFDVDNLGTTPVLATAAMPSTTMKIYRGEPVDGRVAESVKIGDPLTLVVSIDDQDIYGMHIADCQVRDGLGWSDQGLINNEGCPEDWEIMGEFEYSSSKTTALVHFQAHKFPYTSSVYYQCNVRLCIRHAGGCEDTPPICDANGENLLKKRKKRQTLELDETTGLLYDTDREDLKVKVYRGLYVSEANDLDDAFLDDDVPTEVKTYDPSTICFPQRDFAIGIAIAGLVLILIVIIAILCLLSKRRRQKDLSTTGSSIYSGPYTNTAYSHSS